MAKKTFITAELEWAEQQLATWKKYVDANPFHRLIDRTESRISARGIETIQVIATIEQQGKFIQETMKNYLALLEVVDNLRLQEEAKKEARGGGIVPPRMRN